MRTGWTGISPRGPSLIKLSSGPESLHVLVRLPEGARWDAPLRLRLAREADTSGKSAVTLVLPPPGGKAAPILIRGGRTIAPGFRRAPSHPAAWSETALPLDSLGLDPRVPWRFTVEGPGRGVFLKGVSLLSASPLRFAPGAAIAFDGLEDDWPGLEDAWADPAGDAPASADLLLAGLASDPTHLYLHARLAAAPAPRDTGTLFLTVASADSPGTPRTVRLGTDRRRAAPGSAGGEYAIPWSEVGLAPMTRIAFLLRTSGSDHLQGFADLAGTRLRYPARSLLLGAQMFALRPDRLDSLLTAYKAAFLDGKSWVPGRYYDIRLAVHGENGSAMTDDTFLAPGRYDFAELKAIADGFQRNDVAYAPLLAFHYLGAAVERRHDSLFGATRMVSRLGRKLSGNAFLPSIPDAPVNRDWAAGFARAATEALGPHLGTAVPLILAGNEAMYPGNQQDAYPYDTVFTAREWGRYLGRGKAELPGKSTRPFALFRSRRLNDMLGHWTSAAWSAAGGRIPVSTKLVPYAFHAGEFRRNGNYPYVYDYLARADVATIAVDCYPPGREDLQRAYRLGKPMVLAEYSLPAPSRRDRDRDPSRGTVADWLVDAVTVHGLAGAFFYSWNSDEPSERMGPEQIRGVRDAIARLAVLPAPPARDRLVRCLLPADRHLFEGELGMAPPDHIHHLEGWVRFAAALHGSRPDLAVELDYRSRGDAPDLVVAAVSDTLRMTEAEAAERRAVYLLRNPGARILIGTRMLRAAGPVGDVGGSACILADSVGALPPGTRLMDWTPAWRAGVKHIETDLPKAGRRPGWRTLAETDGKPAMVRIGKGMVVMSGDIFWQAGRDTVGSVPVDFLRDLASGLVGP